MADALATRQPVRLVADPSRVITRLFVPGHDIPGGREGRVSEVIDHVLALGDDDVADTLAGILERFGGRHRDLTETFRHHAGRIGNRLDPAVQLSDTRWLLLGATFTHECAVEAAALCNPSVVAHPDQSGTAPGSLRFVMSVRQIGEGHISSVGFRTGVIDHLGAVTIDPAGPFTEPGTTRAAALDAGMLGRPVLGADGDTEAATWVMARLGEQFTVDELDTRLVELQAQHDTRRNVAATVERLRELAARTYTAHFATTSRLDERVLHPATAAEANGLEDARFVRFTDEDGSVTNYATYTAFSGGAINLQLLATDDFRTFTVSPLLGAAAANKGMALFPRRVGGRFAALTRHDGANNAIAFSDDLRQWPTATPLECPTATWEAIQVGNCGPPIETDEGWLVLTHGVGPMRSYAIGAWLLDLDDPTTVIGHLREPLLAPRPDEQDGYVPNVVYSCGSLVHDGTLLVPYGIGDAAIGIATVVLADLLEEILADDAGRDGAHGEAAAE